MAAAGAAARVVCTRKTTPGLRALEKYAVRAGGGANHRFGLDDAVLIKDNHRAVAGGVAPAVERVARPGRPPGQDRGRGRHPRPARRSPRRRRRRRPARQHAARTTSAAAVALARGRALTEASGGITPDTAAAVAATGVDLLSIGWLTHSAPALDVSLEVERVDRFSGPPPQPLSYTPGETGEPLESSASSIRRGGVAVALTDRSATEQVTAEAPGGRSGRGAPAARSATPLAGPRRPRARTAQAGANPPHSDPRPPLPARSARPAPPRSGGSSGPAHRRALPARRRAPADRLSPRCRRPWSRSAPPAPQSPRRRRRPAAAGRPEWLRIRLATPAQYHQVRRLVDGLNLNTVCAEARCPNIYECWGEHGTATFMILGDVCTRRCGFCAVTSGRPAPGVDADEPRHVAEAVAAMGLRHAVVTSVDRDDLPDGGAAPLRRRHRRRPPARPRATAVEVLTPDFRGVADALDVVLGAAPEVFSHNVETVPRMYRPGAAGEPLRALAGAARRGRAPPRRRRLPRGGSRPA